MTYVKSHKDWELSTSQNCLAEIGIDHGLVLPLLTGNVPQ